MLRSILKPKNLISLTTCVLKPELSSCCVSANRRPAAFSAVIIPSDGKRYISKSVNEPQSSQTYKSVRDFKAIAGLESDEIEISPRGGGRGRRKKSRNEEETKKADYSAREMGNEVREERSDQRDVETQNYYDGGFEALEMERNFQSSNDPKDFGKIVCLDLEEVESVSERGGRKSKKKNKSIEAGAPTKGEEEEFVGGECKAEGKSAGKLQFKEEMKASPTLRSTMIKLKSRKKRLENQEIIVEGKRLIAEAILAGVVPKKIFFSRISDVENLGLPETVKLIKVRYNELSLWSSVTTSQGVIGIFKMPDLSIPRTNCTSLPFTVICDNIRDPGNMGAILRVAAGAGCEKVILTKGCVDIWEGKVLRAGAGAHFKLPLIKKLLWTEIESEVPEDSKVVLADNAHFEVDSEVPEDTKGVLIDDANCPAEVDERQMGKESSSYKNFETISEDIPLCSYDAVDYSHKKTVIVIGGETVGLSAEAAEFTVKRQGIKVFIPMSNGIESLNNAVAFGILSYEVRRQLECSNRSQSNETQKIVELST